MDSDDGNCNTEFYICVIYKAYLRKFIMFHKRAFLSLNKILN